MANNITNAVRIAQKEGAKINIYEYESKDGKIDGISVANKLQKPSECVYKTLVTQGLSREYYVFVIPVEKELDLKKCAKAAGEKNITMVHVDELLKLTGYVRGGCSPIGMKKKYRTIIDESCNEMEKIIVSGGKIGLQIEINVADLTKITEADIYGITKE